MIQSAELTRAIEAIVAALTPASDVDTRAETKSLANRLDELERAVFERLDAIDQKLDVIEQKLAAPAERQAYTVKTLAARLSRSERTVWALIHKPDPAIESYLDGGSRRIDPAAVDSYLERRGQAGDREA